MASATQTGVIAVFLSLQGKFRQTSFLLVAEHQRDAILARRPDAKVRARCALRLRAHVKSSNGHFTHLVPGDDCAAYSCSAFPQRVDLNFQVSQGRGHKSQLSLAGQVLNRSREGHGLFGIEVRHQAAQAVGRALDVLRATHRQSGVNCPQKSRGVFDKVTGKLSQEFLIPTKALERPGNWQP